MRYAAAALLAAALLLPAIARGHVVQLPIGGFAIVVDTAGVLADRAFEFSTLTQPQLNGSHDPRVEPTWLLVRGYGPNGGTSGRIDLDSASWSATAEGYAYDDPSGSRGGIQTLTLQQGSLVVLGGGPNWPWDPAGPQQSVWFYFGIDEESFCASFGGAITQNQAGSFEASSAIAPAACPVAVCSNGVVELGEACDDGNLVDDDGCTARCEVGSCVGDPFDSTLEAIQELVFEDRGCTSGVCHGFDPGQGGLDLRADMSYAAMLDVSSTGSSFLRIEPGSPRDSSLYLKLLKAIEPTTNIPGAPMPQGLPPLPDDLLEAVRLYIETGAPEFGTVPGTEALLGGCFPPPEPIEIAPLQPPDPEVGVQLAMPPWDVAAQSESEVCFATYYDFTDVVPESFQDPEGETFYVRRDDTRGDPHSHHLVVFYSGLDDSLVTHPDFGTWRCVGGESDGNVCNPLDTSSCGEGLCRSRVDPSVACIGFGPGGGPTIGNLGGLLGPITPAPGLYTRIPLKGIVYWNSHTFNLTDRSLSMHAWRNFFFASSRRHEVSSRLDSSQIFVADGQAPYTRDTYCHDHILPQDTQLVSLSSHTHKRGEEFWIEDPDGQRIYDTFLYSDPLIQAYRPPLSFESSDPADRTLTYCATYNNGVAADGSPDPSTVRSRSTTPSNGFPCQPVACTDGLVGAPCFGASDHARCDSVPGAGDGFCDACAITGGVTTEDEMFILITSSYVPEPGAGWLAGAALSAIAAIRATVCGTRPGQSPGHPQLRSPLARCARLSALARLSRRILGRGAGSLADPQI